MPYPSAPLLRAALLCEHKGQSASAPGVLKQLLLVPVQELERQFAREAGGASGQRRGGDRAVAAAHRFERAATDVIVFTSSAGIESLRYGRPSACRTLAAPDAPGAAAPVSVCPSPVAASSSARGRRSKRGSKMAARSACLAAALSRATVHSTPSVGSSVSVGLASRGGATQGERRPL